MAYKETPLIVLNCYGHQALNMVNMIRLIIINDKEDEEKATKNAWWCVIIIVVVVSSSWSCVLLDRQKHTLTPRPAQPAGSEPQNASCWE